MNNIHTIHLLSERAQTEFRRHSKSVESESLDHYDPSPISSLLRKKKKKDCFFSPFAAILTFSADDRKRSWLKKKEAADHKQPRRHKASCVCLGTRFGIDSFYGRRE